MCCVCWIVELLMQRINTSCKQNWMANISRCANCVLVIWNDSFYYFTCELKFQAPKNGFFDFFHTRNSYFSQFFLNFPILSRILLSFVDFSRFFWFNLKKSDVFRRVSLIFPRLRSDYGCLDRCAVVRVLPFISRRCVVYVSFEAMHIHFNGMFVLGARARGLCSWVYVAAQPNQPYGCILDSK